MTNLRYLTREINEKSSRLEELKDCGLNIPRYIYLPKNDLVQLNRVLFWAKIIHKSSPTQIFNIRTYSYFPNSQKESSSNPHITDIQYEDLESSLRRVYSNYISLIDAETPDNGLISGNLFYESLNEFSLEFVIKPKRAMVRDINKESFFAINSFPNLSYEEVIFNFLNSGKFTLFLDTTSSSLLMDLPYPEIFSAILTQAANLRRTNIIIEFTYFKSPSGIFYNRIYKNPIKSNIVYWEYRSF